MPNWKKIIVSGSDASLNTLIVANGITGSLLGTASYAIQSLSSSYAATASSADSFVVRNSLTASGLRYPTADNGSESFMQTDGSGNLSFQYVKTIYEQIYNGEATTLVKGTPVYVSGSVGSNPIVYRADPTNPSKMPVIYIVADNLASGATGRGIALGLIKGVDTTGYPAGTEIYLAPGGGWTSIRPTGSSIVQVLGYVTKEGNGGQGVVLNPGPVSLPNLTSGSIWVGNASSVPTMITTSSIQNVVSSSYATSALSSSYAVTASYALASAGGISGLTTNYITKATSATTIGNSQIFDNGSNVGINTTTPSYKLDVDGTANVNGTLRLLSTGAPTIRTTGNRLTINEPTSGPTQETGFVTQFSSGIYGRCLFAITHTGTNTAFFGLNGGSNFTIGAQLTTPIVFKQQMSYTATDILSSGVEIMRLSSAGNVLIGTTSDGSAILHAASTTKGFLKPVMTTTQKNAISTPATGLEVFDTDITGSSFYNGSAWALNTNTLGLTSGAIPKANSSASLVDSIIKDNGSFVSISGSLTVTGSLNALSITSSLLGTASYATNALTASFATTASYALASAGGISGLTTNYITKATSATTIGNSQIFDNGTSVGIGTISPPSTYKLSVNGGLNSIGDNVFNQSTTSAFSTKIFNRLPDIYHQTVFEATGLDGRFKFRSNSPSQVVTGTEAFVTIDGRLSGSGAVNATQNALSVISSYNAYGGGSSIPITLSANTSLAAGTNTTANGVFTTGSVTGDGAATLYGLRSQLSNTSTGNVTLYGLYVSATGATNNFGVYSNAGKNYFANQIGVGIINPDASCILDLTSTTQGFGLPSMTTTQQNAISSPRAGLSVYNSTLGYPTYYNGSSWNAFFSGWGLTGNAGTSATTNFIGTTDNVDVVFRRNNTVSGLIGSTNTGFGLFTITTSATGTANVNFGYACGSKLTTGSDNTAIGSEAANENLTGTANVSVGKSAGRNNTSGNYNTLVGSYAGASLTTNSNNIALGYEALRFASSGNNNIAIGNKALYNNQGNENYAIGSNSLQNNSTGTGNVAFGPRTLENNTTGNNNVAIGYRAMLIAGAGSSNVAVGLQALYSNSAGNDNVALGYATLQANTSSYNTGVGSQALLNNTSGNFNTATGYASLFYNTTGIENTIFGANAGFNNTTGSQNTFIGRNAGYFNTTGVKNIYIGSNAATYFLNSTGDKNIIIGVDARQPTPGASNQLNIGNVLWGANCTGTADTPAGQLSVGAAVPHTSAIFDLTSTTKGLGLPQMTTGQINAISTPKSGLTVYNTDLNTICFYNGTSWQKVTSTAM